jgi:hypothetical protein
MKKLISSFIILFSVIFTSAQSSDENKRINFGLYGGGNISQLLTDSVSETKARIGYQAGAFIRYGEKLFIRGDVAMFGMSSMLIDANDTLGLIQIGMTDIEDKIDLQFIHVPVQLGFKLFQSPDGSSSFWIAAGAYMDQIYNVKDNDLGISMNDFEKTSFGAIGSAGFDLWFLTFQLNYHHGLSPIFKLDDQSMKYTLSFSAGVKF